MSLKCFYLKRCLSMDKSVGLLPFSRIPGPKKYPVIGTMYKYLPFFGDYNTKTLDKNAWLNWKRYGPLVREEVFGGVSLLHLFDPEDIEAVFRQDTNQPARRSHLAMYHYRTNKPDVYNTGGILATNGSEWQRLRSAFQKNFTQPQSAKEYVEKTDKVVTEFLDWMSNRTLNDDDFLPYLNRLNLETIGVIAFNECFNSFSQEELNKGSKSSKLIDAAFGSNLGIVKLDNGVLWRYINTPLYNRMAKSQAYLERVAQQILTKNSSFYESNNKTENCLLNSFLKQKNVDFKDITGMIVDILMAAIDTTSYTTSFALYYLAKNLDVQQKLYQEIKSLLPNKTFKLDADVLNKASYTKCCVKESLRLNPVSIGIGRELQNDIIIKGYMVPAGTIIVTQNMIAGRLPQNVKEPLSFKPERWLRGSEHYEELHPFLSIPFGFGPRTCIARRIAEQNICVTIFRIIQEYSIKWNGGDLGIETHLINKPDQPLKFTFNKRS